MKKLGLIAVLALVCGVTFGGTYLVTTNVSDIRNASYSTIAGGAASNFVAWVDTGTTLVQTNLTIATNNNPKLYFTTNSYVIPAGTYTPLDTVVNSNFVYQFTDGTNIWNIEFYGQAYSNATWRLFRQGTDNGQCWTNGYNAALATGVWGHKGTATTGTVTITKSIVTNDVYAWTAAFSGTTNVTTNSSMTFVNGVLIK